MVTLLIILVVLVGMIAWLKYDDEKTLNTRDVYFAAKDMTSYSSEAYLVATTSQNQPLVGPYREVYVQQLASNVSEVKDKLVTHESQSNLRPNVAKLLAICDQLRDILDTLTRQPSDQAFAAHAAEIQTLAGQAKAIEDSL